jgi:short subunit fatty acids transporter
MAIEIINQTIGDGLASSMVSTIGNLPGMATIFQISQAIGIVVLIYFVILIFKAIVQTRQAARIKELANNISEINQKMDILIGKKGAAKKAK